MTELFRTNDPALLSWAVALLRAEGIEVVVLDGHTAALEGSIGAIPRRLAVRDEDGARAHRLVEEAGILGEAVVTPGPPARVG
jgi:hypothetical protein